jgi:hypothetical protein
MLRLPLTAIDIGAAGELVDFGDLNALCEMHAFEPRQEACDGLANKAGLRQRVSAQVARRQLAGLSLLVWDATGLRRTTLPIDKEIMGVTSQVPNHSGRVRFQPTANAAATRRYNNKIGISGIGHPLRADRLSTCQCLPNGPI